MPGKYLTISYQSNGKKLKARLHSKDVYIENSSTAKRQQIYITEFDKVELNIKQL